MDISAIEDDIEDLEKTILSICSDTSVDENACSDYVTVDNLTNDLTSKSSESACTEYITVDSLTNNLTSKSSASRTEISGSDEQSGMPKCTDGNINSLLIEIGTEKTQTERDVDVEIICDRTNAKLMFKGRNGNESSVCEVNKNKENEMFEKISTNSKSPADIEKEILAFTPIKCDRSSSLLTPVARYSHTNIMNLRKQHSTPNPHSHSIPLFQTRRDLSADISVTSQNTANLFSVIKISDDTFETTDSYSVIEISEDPFEKTFEELLQEVTQLCDEHTAKTGETGDMFHKEAESATDHQISQIDLEQLLSSSPKVKIKHNIAIAGRLSLSVSQIADPNYFNDVKQKGYSEDMSPGRFKGVDKSKHIYDESLVDDLGDASEDILGLDAFSFSDDETDDLETTVIPIPQSEITLQQPDVSGPSISASSDSTVIISHVKPFVSTVADKESKTKKPKLDHIEKLSVLEGITTTDAYSITPETFKEEKPNEKVTPSTDVDDKKDKLIQSSLVAERRHLLQETELMKFIKDKWKTTGIQRPDVNLTKCNRLHTTQKDHLSPGLLEGEDRIPPLIRTINNYTQSNSDQTAGPDAKRRRVEAIQKCTIGQTTADLVKSLKGQLDEINGEWQRKQNFLHQQKLHNESELKQRHSDVLHSLRVRQQLELQNIKHQFLYNPFLLQFRMLQLHEEHTFQAGRLRDVHRKEMEEVRREAFYKHATEKDSYLRLSEQLNGMIRTFENKDVANIISKEGSYVAVDLWKGPCRSNKLTKSLVKVCLPADIASYIMREDEIYDMFYAY